jgi:hypothetical protein
MAQSLNKMQQNSLGQDRCCVFPQGESGPAGDVGKAAVGTQTELELQLIA